MRSIYFDYNATTPLDPTVREAMLPYLSEIYGNPSSIHHVGRRARAALDEARERVAGVLGCQPHQILFTSGGTESNNLALLGAARKQRHRGSHIIVSAVEHHAVLHPCRWLSEHEGFRVTYLPVDQDGRVAFENVERALRPDTILVSLMAANNEVGTIQPFAEVGALCRSRGVVFHTDAVQWFGKEPFSSIHQFHAPLVSLCAHKFHGPKGAGLLFAESPHLVYPILVGGSHEYERRAGTENLAAIVGMAVAIERFLKPPVIRPATMTSLIETLRGSLASIPRLTIRTPPRAALCNTVAFTVEGCESATLLAALDLGGVCASSGSACAAGSLEPSHVLAAMGIPPPLSLSLVRFSLGRESSNDEVQYAVEALSTAVSTIRSTSCA